MSDITVALLEFHYHRAIVDSFAAVMYRIFNDLFYGRSYIAGPKSAISSAGIQVASKLIIIGPSYTRLPAYPFLLRLRVYRNEVELAVEVHDDDAVAALFALVIMDLSRRLRPHGSRPACLRCCSLESMRELTLDHDALIRRRVPVPARVHARRKLLQDLRGALVWIPPHREHLQSRVLGIDGLPRNGVARREGTLGRSGLCARRRSRARASIFLRKCREGHQRRAKRELCELFLKHLRVSPFSLYLHSFH